jgi:hypothetical protein
MELLPAKCSSSDWSASPLLQALKRGAPHQNFKTQITANIWTHYNGIIIIAFNNYPMQVRSSKAFLFIFIIEDSQVERATGNSNISQFWSLAEIAAVDVMGTREKMNRSRFASPWASTAHISVIGEYLAMPYCSEFPLTKMISLLPDQSQFWNRDDRRSYRPWLCARILMPRGLS